MDSIKLQNKIQIFSKRLEVLGVDMALAAKYISIYQTVLMSQEIPENELLERKGIQLLGLVAQKQVFYPQKTAVSRFVLNEADPDFNKSKLCRFKGVELSDDLLALCKTIPKSVTTEKADADSVSLLEEITIYSLGSETELYYRTPSLRLKDVLSQIPAYLLAKVKAFALDMDESPFECYNMLLGMYAFKVKLYD